MMDFVLEAWVEGGIERAKARWMLGKGKPWQPGEKLKLLFAGYNGARNMGSDVRVEEMLRQIRHILGEDRVALSVMSQNFEFTRGYFAGTTQVHLPDIFPPFLSREVPRHHGVVACEGSMSVSYTHLHTVLRGISRDRLDLLGEEYFKYKLEPHLKAAGVRKLKELVDSGAKVVLVSQGLAQVMQPLARHLGVNWVIANRMEFRDGMALSLIHI